MSFYLYILQSKSTGKYYTGSTSDLNDRLKRHLSGRSKYTKRDGPWELAYSEEYETRVEAQNREREIKKWKSHDRIHRLIENS